MTTFNKIRIMHL